jgi:hypothetical protein
VVIIGTALLAAAFGTCPCVAAATPTSEGHDCCPGEPGLRAAAVDCCGGEAVAPQASTGPAGIVALNFLPERTPLVSVASVRCARMSVVTPSPSGPSHTSILRI